jgi:CRP-like cAMP-binding protein
MHDRLFAGQDRLLPTDLLEYAAAAGVDVSRFARDLGSSRFARRVEEDVESAEASGVTGTPTFFVNGRRHTGPFDTDSLTAALLAAAGEEELPPSGDDGLAGLVVPALGQRRGQYRPEADDVPADVPADLPESPDRDGAFPRLTDEQIALVERSATRLRCAPGDTLFREGDAGYAFHVVVSGTVAIVEDLGRTSLRVISVHGPHRFLGELDLFSGQPVSLTALVLQPAEVLRVEREQLRAVFTADPALKEMVLRAFLLRRSRLLELAADLRIVGRGGSPDSRRLQELARSHRLAAGFVDLDAGGDGAAVLAELGVTEDDLPVVVWRRGEVLRNPSDDEVLAAVESGA